MGADRVELLEVTTTLGPVRKYFCLLSCDTTGYWYEFLGVSPMFFVSKKSSNAARKWSQHNKRRTLYTIRYTMYKLQGYMLGKFVAYANDMTVTGSKHQ